MRLPGGGEVVGLSIDPKAALLEYLQMFYKLGRAGRLLEKFGAIDFATTIAPGVRDVLLIGKIYEANRRRRDGRHKGDSAPVYDGIVLDAPPTGRIGRFLSVNSEVADLARVGPIASQADLDHPAAPVGPDGRPRRHPPRGDAGAGDPRVDRRAARQGPAPGRRHRQHGARAAPRRRRARPGARGSPAQGVDPHPARRGRRRRDTRARRRPARGGPRPRRAHRPRARAARAPRGHGPADRPAARAADRRRLRLGARARRPARAALRPSLRDRHGWRHEPGPGLEQGPGPRRRRPHRRPARPRSSSAAAPAASARRRRPRRSACGPPSRAARSSS